MPQNKKELEIVQHTQMNFLEIFLIEMISRQPHGHEDLEFEKKLGCTVKEYLRSEKEPVPISPSLPADNYERKYEFEKAREKLNGLFC
ncbi:MAG: hypothetical protein LIO76_01715 [Clostridiales bacterium]|nr:hypothetical protein [Clostridiales bacterium]